MTIKAKFENGHFIPLDRFELKDLDGGEVVEIEFGLHHE